MKIAHILPSSVHTHGGLPLLAREIALGLKDSHETYVMCPEYPNADHEDALLSSEINLIEWPAKAKDKSIARLTIETLELHDIRKIIIHGGDFSWGLLRGNFSLINRLATKDRKIIYVNHQSNAILGRVPTGEERTHLARLKSFCRFASAWTLKNLQLLRTDIEISVSEFEFQQARRRYFLFQNKFRLIYHSRLPAALPEHDITTQKEKSILSVGHFAFRKGQHVLLRAFGRVSAEYPDWKLYLVGANEASEYRSFIEAIIDEFEIRDRVVIVTETHKPDEYFKNASIYVQPSLMEAYGLALQEAMHFGCACVGSRAGGIPDSVKDEQYLFPPGDDTILSSILDRLMQNADLLDQRMKHSLKESSKLQRNQETMIAAYRELLIDLPGTTETNSGKKSYDPIK